MSTRAGPHVVSDDLGIRRKTVCRRRHLVGARGMDGECVEISANWNDWTCLRTCPNTQKKTVLLRTGSRSDTLLGQCVRFSQHLKCLHHCLFCHIVSRDFQSASNGLSLLPKRRRDSNRSSRRCSRSTPRRWTFSTTLPPSGVSVDAFTFLLRCAALRFHCRIFGDVFRLGLSQDARGLVCLKLTREDCNAEL